jgi:hypothetical protein
MLYEISPTSSTLTFMPVIVQSQSGCPITCDLLVDGATPDGSVFYYDISNGQVNVVTQDPSKVGIKTLDLTCTSNVSIAAPENSDSQSWTVEF